MLYPYNNKCISWEAREELVIIDAMFLDENEHRKTGHKIYKIRHAIRFL
jgi:hypothetical protein